MKSRWRDFADRLNRRIDQSLVKGQFHVVGLLAAAALLAAAVSTLLMVLFDAVPDEVIRGQNQRPGVAGTLWQALVRTLDPGQIATDHHGAALIGLLTTIVGLLLLSTLISIVNTRVELRVDRVKRGRKPVDLSSISRGSGDEPMYIVILGWTDLTLRILKELAQSHIANKPPTVLVLAVDSVDDMRHRVEELRRSEHKDFPGDWPQLRTGNPTDTRDLIDIAKIENADAVIVLAPESSSRVVAVLEYPDELCAASAEVVKTVLAVSACFPFLVTSAANSATSTAILKQSQAQHIRAHKVRTHRERPTVVVEIPENALAGSTLEERLKTRLGQDRIQVLTLDGAAIQARLAAQVSRKAGLSGVYQELLDFAGCEIHLLDMPPHVKEFGEAVSLLDGGIAFGLMDKNGNPELWPDWDYPVANQRLVALMQDARSPSFDRQAGWARRLSSRPGWQVEQEPESISIIGWNHRGSRLVEALQGCLPSGSRIKVFACGEEPPGLPVDEDSEFEWHDLPLGIQHWLDQHPPELRCDHTVVLADNKVLPAVSDANVLLTLLTLRHPDNQLPKPDTVVAELRQRPNRHLASKRFTADLIVGDSLVAMLLAQYAVEPELKLVFEQIIDPQGDQSVEIELINLDQIQRNLIKVVPSESDLDLTFGQVQDWASAQGGIIALGYRLSSDHRPSEICLNPDPTTRLLKDADSKIEVVVLNKAV